MKKFSFMEDPKWIFDGDYGVKGFEIKFQDKIEDVIPKDLCWWQVVDKQIFNDISAIYNNRPSSILISLWEYYEEIKVIVDAFITQLNNIGRSTTVRGDLYEVKSMRFVIQEKPKDDPQASEFGKTTYVVAAQGYVIDTTDNINHAKDFGTYQKAENFIAYWIASTLQNCYSVVEVQS